MLYLGGDGDGLGMYWLYNLFGEGLVKVGFLLLDADGLVMHCL